MFCEKCGKELVEGEVCSCQKPKKKKVNPAVIVLAVIVLAIIALVVTLILNADSGSSESKKDDKEKEEKSTYMDPIDNYLAIVNKRNDDSVELVESMMPEFSVKKFKAMMEIIAESEYFADEIEAENENLADYYEEADDEFEGWKISFKKEDAEKLDAETLEEYSEEAEEYYEDDLEYMVESFEEIIEDKAYLEDVANVFELSMEDSRELMETMIAYYKAYEEVEVTAGYEVTGKFILKADGETYETESLSFIVLKINGSWVYWGLTDYGYLGFEEDDYGVFDFFFRELSYSKFVIDSLF